MNRKKLSIGIFFILLCAGCKTEVASPASQSMHMTDLHIGGTVVHARIAKTQEEQERGLGGTPMLNWDEGMFFPFAEKSQVAFWMKDMLIPIDIIWLSDNRIVGIEKNVPMPQPGQLTDDLPKYTSPISTNQVLEVKAGFADKYSLQIGDTIGIK